MPVDDRVIQLNTAVDELVGIVAALAIPFTHLRIEESRILGSVDLDVGAAQTYQLVNFTPGEGDDVLQVSIPVGVSGLRLLGIVVGRRLLRAQHGYFSRVGGAGAQVDPFFRAHAPAPAQ